MGFCGLFQAKVPAEIHRANKLVISLACQNERQQKEMAKIRAQTAGLLAVLLCRALQSERLQAEGIRREIGYQRQVVRLKFKIQSLNSDLSLVRQALPACTSVPQAPLSAIPTADGSSLITSAHETETPDILDVAKQHKDKHVNLVSDTERELCCLREEVHSLRFTSTKQLQRLADVTTKHEELQRRLTCMAAEHQKMSDKCARLAVLDDSSKRHARRNSSFSGVGCNVPSPRLRKRVDERNTQLITSAGSPAVANLNTALPHPGAAPSPTAAIMGPVVLRTSTLLAASPNTAAPCQAVHAVPGSALALPAPAASGLAAAAIPAVAVGAAQPAFMGVTSDDSLSNCTAAVHEVTLPPVLRPATMPSAVASAAPTAMPVAQPALSHALGIELLVAPDILSVAVPNDAVVTVTAPATPAKHRATVPPPVTETTAPAAAVTLAAWPSWMKAVDHTEPAPIGARPSFTRHVSICCSGGGDSFADDSSDGFISPTYGLVTEGTPTSFDTVGTCSSSFLCLDDASCRGMQQQPPVP